MLEALEVVQVLVAQEAVGQAAAQEEAGQVAVQVAGIKSFRYKKRNSNAKPALKKVVFIDCIMNLYLIFYLLEWKIVYNVILYKIKLFLLAKSP